ncbi:MAG: TPR end-of-group domain-containing protein, partial [Planctomycetota bacterium]|jgi:tetratricopeptide (TPR) repeat protein
LKRNPRAWEPHANRGRILELLGDFERAAEDYESALAIVKDGIPMLKKDLARVRALVLVPPWARELRRAGEILRRGDYAGARDVYEKALAQGEKPGAHGRNRFQPLVVTARYNLACIYSLASTGKKAMLADPEPCSPEEATSMRQKALANLRKALELGYKDLDHIRKDSDLAPLRDLPEFEALLAEYEEKLKKEN